MNIAPGRLAVFFRETGYLDDTQWNTYLRSAGQHKNLTQVLKQDVSLGTFKDLMFAEIGLPFASSKREPITDALSTQIRITATELGATLKAFRPDIRKLMKPFIDAGLANPDDVDAALKQRDLGESDPYSQLIRQNVLTPEVITRFFGQPEQRRDWPYRQELALLLFETSGLLDADAAGHARAHSASPDAILQKFQGNGAKKGGSVMVAAKDGLTFPVADLTRIDIDTAHRVPGTVARRHKFIPLSKDNLELNVAFADPFNVAAGDLLALLSGRRIRPWIADEAALIEALDRIYEPSLGTQNDAMPAARVESMEESSSTVKLVSSIVEGAIELNATDVHLEPAADGRMRVRYRLDGRLRNILMIPQEMTQPSVSRIKVLANMNVTERRRPQDGHFDLQVGENRFDFRISTLPCALGEKIVIRILDDSRVVQGLEELGLDEGERKVLENLCRQPYGMALVTGPTGSGKTSTLYACLSTVNSLEANIVTIEDPVEYQLPGVNQMQVNPEIQLGFAEGLRSILRQDPDVIMVGEIRDKETAYIAVRAALTGHLVFSTLHTNTAIGAFSALMHLDVKPYLCAGAVLAIVGQRLVRKICADCAQPATVNSELMTSLWPDGKAQPLQTFRGRGCTTCMDTGYKGRTAIFEIVRMTQALRDLVAAGASESELMKQAVSDGFSSMRESGIRKIERGITTVEEVCRETMTMGGC